MATGTASPVGGASIGGTALVTFTSAAPAGQVDSGIVLLWDLDNDGDWDEPEEDITAYVMSLECDIGRSWPSLLNGDPQPGRLHATLLNNAGRFSYFNASSPLATAPFSLKPGRAMRVRLATATDTDPVLLVRDRFERSNNPASLGAAETGQSWLIIETGGGFGIVDGGAQGHANNAVGLAAGITIGQQNAYVQAQVAYYTPQQLVGLVVAHTGSGGGDKVRMYLNTDTEELHITQTHLGAGADLLTQAQPMWDGMTIGLGVVGTAATAYIDGVAVATVTLPNAPSGTWIGPFAQWNLVGGRAPKFLDFWAWDKVAAPIAGVLWTGDVENIEPTSVPGGPNVVTLTGDGRLIRAANEVASPRLARAGQRTGVLVGDALARAGLLHPPLPLSAGDVTTGPVAIADDTALQLARGFEATELGTIRETPEGRIAYDARSAPAAAPSAAWFTDTPGVGQYDYSSITPKDHRGDLVNEAGARVAALTPVIRSQAFHTPGSSHVDITIPAGVLQGDLIIVAVASSLRTAGVEWLKPLWWQMQYDRKDEYGTRIYTRPSDGTESGTTVRFYDNTAGATGVWGAQITVVKAGTWFGVPSGFSAGEVVSGYDPGPADFGWGRYPTLFLAYGVGLGAVAPGGTFTTTAPPSGYTNMAGTIVFGTVDALDVGMVSGYKVDVTDTENAGLIIGLNNFITTESFVLAVRGWNGPHTAATLDNPNTIGGDGVRVSRADTASQHEHQVKRVAQVTPVHFATTGDAETYLDAVLTGYATERPVLELSFVATSSAALRDQAVARRQGDKITVTATGDAGLGIESDFVIGHLGHSFTNGGKRWVVTWQLAPA